MFILGLGNPGEKYKNTRHNIGFRIIDEFKGKNNFPEFKLSKKFYSLISENISNDEKIILAKPQTFMNLSGETVQTLTSFYKIKTKDIIIIHDDIDLPLGKIRISKGRGSAGHKGIESIISKIGSNNFTRIRIGVCAQKEKPKNPERFVIQKFSKKEEAILKKVIKKANEAIETLIKEGLETAMNKYNS